ncbi:MAG: serine/threonine-protein kinase, partial [Deltaproteobacteria bacterium]
MANRRGPPEEPGEPEPGTPGDAASDGSALEATVACSRGQGAPAAQPPDPSPGASSDPRESEVVAGRYTLLRILGSGAAGSVYCARDNELGEMVALKILNHSGGGDGPEQLEFLRREVRLARRVTHPNIARTFDIGEHAGRRFLTMEYIDGEALSAPMCSGPMPIRAAVDMLFKICAGLSAAHNAGVIHRDLKPDNVMIARDGRVVITDFGIAHGRGDAAEGPQFLVGTPAYMAPEQVQGVMALDGRADLYALGVIAYRMFTGKRPWSGPSPEAVARARLEAPPPDPRTLRPELSEVLGQMTQRLMATRREDRFARAEDVAVAIAMAPDWTDDVPERAPTATAERPDRSPPEASFASRARSVAVLPFRFVGPEHEAYVAEGMSEDLTDALSSVRGMRVRPHAAAGPSTASEDVAAIGRALDVKAVVVGTVRRVGEGFRVSASLVSVEDGFQVWSLRVDASAGDLLATTDTFARGIARALSTDVTLPPRPV